MGQVSAFLRNTVDGYSWWCPGCEEMHAVKVGAGGWTWNGNKDRPSFTPSVLVTSGHYTPGDHGGCWCKFNAERIAKGLETSGFKCERCHCYVTDGKIQFLPGCTHALAGKTVPMPPLPPDLRDDP
jgi:hypothetical protein